jgi:hypothetical protein
MARSDALLAPIIIIIIRGLLLDTSNHWGRFEKVFMWAFVRERRFAKTTLQSGTFPCVARCGGRFWKSQNRPLFVHPPGEYTQMWPS